MDNHAKPQFGLVSTDGFLQPVSTLTVEGLEYVLKPKAELEALLKEKIELELYEECVLIRNELSKR